MNKHTIITTLRALIAITGQGQTAKAAIITGYSPVLNRIFI